MNRATGTLLAASLLLLAQLATPVALAVPPTFTITEIPTLGGVQGEALGINNLGQVVGWAELPSGHDHAYLWDAGVITDLGTLGGNLSYAYDINDAGRIVGQSEAVAIPSFRFAFYIDPGDSMQTALANLPNTGNAIARTVNQSGELAGASLTIDELDAVIWDTQSAAIFPLPSFLDEPLGQGDVWDSNDANDLVGWSKFFDPDTGYIGFRAALWPGGQPQGNLIDLGALGGSYGQARGINNLKQVVGTAGLAVAQAHAFLWKGGNMQDLGDLGDGTVAVHSVGQDINDLTQVVGFSQFEEFSTFRAFLWEDGVMYDLNTLIPAGSGWELTHANAISASGQIVGKGLSPTGQVRGFLLTPAGASGPPGVATDMTAGKIDAAGQDLSVDWDPALCPGAAGFQILFGGGSAFPSTPGGELIVEGSECGIGPTSPYTWLGSPDTASEPTALIWWLVVATDGASTEGSWGADSDGFERQGPGGGASLECGVLGKDVSNACP